MKKQSPLPCCSVVAIALGLWSAGDARAQFCLDIFAADSSPFLQCADADFFFAPVDGGFDSAETFSSAGIGTINAALDGDGIFDPGARPANVLDPFFSSVEFTSTTGALGGTTSFTSAHRGSVSMAPADSFFQSAAFGTRSRVTFIPVNTVDPDAPISIMLNLNYTVSLSDPLANDGLGAALGGFGIKLLGGNSGPLGTPKFDVSALVELDLDDTTLEPEFFGFDDPELDDGIIEIDFEPSGPGIDDEFDIEIDIEIELEVDDFDLDIDEPIILELDTFGSIFSDGFESGDTAAWSAASPDTFTFTHS